MPPSKTPKNEEILEEVLPLPEEVVLEKAFKSELPPQLQTRLFKLTNISPNITVHVPVLSVLGDEMTLGIPKPGFEVVEESQIIYKTRLCEGNGLISISFHGTK